MKYTTPFITIVMPVRNEGRFIGDTLMQLLRQDYPAGRFEIVLADGMSDDDTARIAREAAEAYSNIRVIDNRRRLQSAGRNLGFLYGRGDIFLVIDGHCHIDDRWLLKNVARCFEISGADCLGRPQPLDPPGLTEFQKAVALARASMIGHREDSLIYSNYEGYASPLSNGAAYKRGVFLETGYVDESFDACEDVEFNYRVEKAGLRTYTSPALTVRYFPREDIKGLFRQMCRYGRGRFKLVRKHRELLNIETMVPPAFVAGFILLLSAGLLSRLSAMLYAVFVTLYILYSLYVFMIIAESLRIALKHGFRYFKHMPFIFSAIHFGLGWGFLREAASGLAGKRGRRPR